MRLAIGFLVALALLTWGAAADAETRFNAVLDGTQAGTNSSATGEGTFILRDDDTFEYNIAFSPLASGELVSHVHGPAPAGQPAGVVFALPLGSPKVGSTGPLTPAQKSDLLAGLWYVNVHSNQFTSGEIRGQIVPQVVPVEDATWSNVKAQFDTRD